MRSHLPKYITIKHVLKERLSRETSKGSRLPTEAELCAEFSVSRITVQQAMRELESEGLVRRERGRGTFYLGPEPGKPERRVITLIESLLQAGPSSKVELISKQVQAPPEHIAKRLDLPPGAHVVMFQRVGIADNEPVVHINSYVRHDVGIKIFDMDARLCECTIAEILHLDMGMSFSRMIQKTSATLANPQIADLLEVQVGDPILEGERNYFSKDNLPVFCSVSGYRADRYSFEVEFDGTALRFSDQK